MSAILGEGEVPFTFVDETVNTTLPSYHRKGQPSAGNFVSHAHVLDVIAHNHGAPGGVIFEDDVALHPQLLQSILPGLLDRFSGGKRALFFGTCRNLSSDATRDECLGDLCVRSPPATQGTLYAMTRCSHAYAVGRECAQALIMRLRQSSPRHAIDRWLNRELVLADCTVIWTRESYADQASHAAGLPL